MAALTAARRVRRRRLQRERALGHPHRAAGQRRRRRGADRRHPARRPDQHLRRALRGRRFARGDDRHAAPHRAASPTAGRRSGEYDALLRAHGGRRHHALDGRRGRRRRRRLPGRARRGRVAAATTRRPTRPRIPDIFLKETQQVSGQQIVEETFFPVQTASSPILRGLEDGLPQLLGYNGTTAKAAAQTVLVSPARRPGARPVAVRPRAGGGLDIGRDRAAGRRTGSAGTASTGSSASSCAGRSRARSRAAWRPSS